MAVKKTVTRSQEFSDSVIDTVREPLIILDHDLRVVNASRSFYKFFKVVPEETVGQLIYDLGNKQWDIPLLRELLETILPEKATFDDYEVEHDFAAIGRRTMLLNARQIQREPGKEKIILLAIENITERKQLEELLTESEERFRRLFETASDGIVLLEKREGKITHANPATEKMLGYNKKDSIGHKLRDIGISLDMGDFQTTMQNLNKTGILNYDDVPVKTSTGQHIDTDIYLVDRARLVQCNIRDITERKLTEEKLLRTNTLLNSIVENIPDMIFLKDSKELRFVRFNRAGENLLGYSREELLGKSDYDLFPKEQAELFAQKDRDALNSKELVDIAEEPIQTRKRGERILHTKKVSILNEDGEPEYLLGISEDITERKRTEEILRKTEETYRLVVDNMADVITVIDLNFRFTYVSPSIIRLRGYTAEEVMAQTVEQVLTPESLQAIARVFEEELKLEADGTADPCRSRILELEEYKKDGSTVWVENHLSFFRDTRNTLAGIIASGHDITERKLADKRLKESESKYRLLADNVDDVLFVLDMNLNYTYASPAVKTLMGYEPEELSNLRAFETMTSSSWDMSVRTLSEFVEMEKAGQRENKKPQMFELEMKRKDGSTVWTEVKVSFIRDENQRPLGLIGVSRDITNRRLAEAELLRTLDSLKKAVGTTIQVLISALEARDPYTAGHQFRVAHLSCAIATEMGLSQAKIDGIQMAGSIHDIGKLSIPAEILSKPTKLTNLEFSLIKEHAQSGYDMLKDVESPWPLAQIVYQHHERMDGSGYPRKLKGDEILVAARIMAVADVVEAMASHRPYRPGLGIEVALEEIAKNKGILYDEAVADACLKLFREKDYKLLT
jgi:PAS domain S-box-containing protein